MNSNFERYKKELSKENLTSIDDLEKLVTPFIRTATKIEVAKPYDLPGDPQLSSHFGGQPYFEFGEAWPKAKNGNHLNFIFQIWNNGKINLPANIKLVQFFYDWEESPWDTKDDGWFVKIYEAIDVTKRITIDKPKELNTSNFREMIFKTVRSLPDWEGIDLHCEKALKLSCVLDEDEPWSSYQNIVEKILDGGQEYQSQIGGYPKWVQGESTPKKTNGEPMNLLFQIDSEENAGLMWGDCGLVYVFYDEADKQIAFELQCH